MVQEFHDVLRVEDKLLPFSGQLRQVMDQLSELTRQRCVHFVRFFLSDASNQQESLEAKLPSVGSFAVSIVQQAPLDGSKIAAWVYSTDRTPNSAYKHVWTSRLLSSAQGSHGQMEEIFRNYDSLLEAQGMTVRDNCLRTWIFVRDVDTNYSGVVTGRNEFFDRIGLTKETHYIASTGIQGSSPSHENLVLMDAYAVSGLDERQIRHLHALTHLNPTHEYGVAFERGTSITYGDRKHILISGTASIDNRGSIVHPGDVLSQSARMMENISALLADADASLEDIRLSIVYLRDTADYQTVKSFFEKNYPALDPVFVLAPVCRPGWLIEMECIAIRKQESPEFPEY